VTEPETTADGEQLVGIGQNRVGIAFVDGRVVPRQPAASRRSRTRRRKTRKAGRGPLAQRSGPSPKSSETLEGLVTRLETAAAKLELAPLGSKQPQVSAVLADSEICEQLVALVERLVVERLDALSRVRAGAPNGADPESAAPSDGALASPYDLGRDALHGGFGLADRARSDRRS
jgi:hypothetical protein